MFATNQPGEFESLRIKAEKGDAEAEFDMGKCYGDLAVLAVWPYLSW